MAIRTNTPRTKLLGFKDSSIETLVPEVQGEAIHTPLLYLRTQKGKLDPTYISGNDIVRLYGAETVNVRGPYMNHASVMAQAILGEGNAIYVKRVLAGNYATSTKTLVVTLDKTAGVINEYDRNPDGSVIRDVNGAVTFTANAVADGISVKLDFVDTASLVDFTPTGSGDVVTYPILTTDGSSPGVHGDNIGYRLWHANSKSSSPADSNVVDDQGAFIYSLQLVEKQSNGTTVTLSDRFASITQDFAFKPNVYDESTNVDLTIQQAITSYSSDGILAGTSPTVGPLGKITIHQANLEAVLAELLIAEDANAPASGDLWKLDFLGGVSYDGTHHYGFQIDTTGSTFTENRAYYLGGGSDGDLSDAAYDAAVGVEIDTNYDNPEYPLVDTAQYPFSALIDSGYSIPVKKKMMQWLGYKKACHVLIGTHVANETPLTTAEEISVGVDLRAHAILYAESIEFGTGVCRLVISGHDGLLLNSNWKGRLPCTFEIAINRARYLGAANGVMKEGLAYDKYPNNTIKYMTDIRNTWRSDQTKDLVWAAGINFIQYADRSTLFYPAIQTVYGIKNSVLTSDMTMQIGVDVTKYAERAWTRLVSNTNLSDGQLIEANNRFITDSTKGNYQNRVTIEPKTLFTPADKARGFSWTTVVGIYANPMRTTDVISIEFFNA